MHEKATEGVKMTVIAWDGKTLAVDKQITCGDFAVSGTKIRQLEDGTILAWGGHIDTGLIVAEWYEKGADPEKFPISRTEDDVWGELIVVTPERLCFGYCQGHVPTSYNYPMAWGGPGRYAAMAAMLCGRSATVAIEITNQICADCGFGVDYYVANSD